MPSRSALVLYLLLLGSGASGLVYEVCWSRQLGLWLGRGERGAAWTLSLFFVGMALGYAWSAARIAHTRRSLFAYGVCEVVIGASAFALPLFVRGLSPSDGPILWSALLVPTMAMGASLPFAQQAVAERGGVLAHAYAFHLVGAAGGSFLTTFFAIEHLGVWRSTRMAAVVSCLCGVLACLLDRAPAAAPDLSSEQATRVPLSLKLAAAWAGAATLAVQVLSLRLFALTFHNSTYTFGLTVAIFIVYLAYGSRWYERALTSTAIFRDHTSVPVDPEEAVFRSARRAAIGVVLMAPLFATVTRYGVLRAPGFVPYVLLSSVLVLAVLALPVSAAGALLPGLWGMAGGRPGHTVGALSAYNGFGSALGALFSSYVLLPRFGLFTSLWVTSAAYLVLCVLIHPRTLRSFVSIAIVVLLMLVTSKTANVPEPRGYRLRERWDTPLGLLDLLENKADRSLSARLDLHYQLGSSADLARHELMGALPLALHRAPEDVLFVGLATGMTASAALSRPQIKHIEVIELIDEVKLLARRFGSANRNVLEDARVHVSVDDGRSYLAKSPRKFDVIVSDLFVPWHSHAGYLYTVEHFRAVSTHLTPGGVFAQWLPLWQLGEEELELIMNSFCLVFPKGSVWLDARDNQRALLALIAGEHGTGGTSDTWPARRVLSLSRCDRGRVNTDEKPLLEFRAPRAEQDGVLLVGDRLRDYARTRFGAAIP